MPDLHSLPEASLLTRSSVIRNNGPDALALERYKLRELAEGWPCYRDACEWDNFISIFAPGNAFVYTTWTGRISVDKFIEVSKAGMDKGAFIMHRVCGTTTDIQAKGDLPPTRAVTKMKAVITQRFVLEGCEVDVEADCRFCFFWEKVCVSPHSTMPNASPPDENLDLEWRARYVRHFYEKDKLVPVNPGQIPLLDSARLQAYPMGYRHLAYCQDCTMGPEINVKRDMPGHVREGDTVNKTEHDKLLIQCKIWLEGGDVEV